MKAVTKAAIQAGLIDQDTVDQFKRWGAMPRGMNIERLEDPDEALKAIQDAIQSEDQVTLKTTELDMLRHYRVPTNQLRGQVVWTDVDHGQKGTKVVLFCHYLNKFVMPHPGDQMLRNLVNGTSYMRWTPPPTRGAKRVYFDGYDEIYFGDLAAFVALTGEVE